MDTRSRSRPSTAQLVLALTELTRIDREIREIEAQSHGRDDVALRSLHECRAALVRIAERQLRTAPPEAVCS